MSEKRFAETIVVLIIYDLTVNRYANPSVTNRTFVNRANSVAQFRLKKFADKFPEELWNKSNRFELINSHCKPVNR